MTTASHTSSLQTFRRRCAARPAARTRRSHRSRVWAWAGSATAALAIALGSASPAHAGCVATNPPNPSNPNPCSLFYDSSWTYVATGDWEIRVERRDGSVEVLSSENGDPPQGGPGLMGATQHEYVTARAVTPGSSVTTTGDISLVGAPNDWPRATALAVDEDGCASLEDPMLGQVDTSQCVFGPGGTVIRYTLVLPQAAKDGPVPLLIAAHGFGGDRRGFLGRNLTRGWTAFALAHGYALLAYDARGHGDSGGEIEFNDPAFEGRDVSAIIDKIAADPRIAQEAPGDPRVGMVGASYGGEIQLVAAALDERIDAIVPNMAWNNLYTALFPRGVVRAGWSTLLPLAMFGALEYPGFMQMHPARWESGTLDRDIALCGVHAAAAGDASPDCREWWEGIGPWNLLEDFDTPTMILHGQQDTLLPPSQAVANFQSLARSLRPDQLRMRWYCGGHGTCKPNYYPRIDEQLREYEDATAFLDRWVKGDKSVDTGPTFAYLTQDGRWHDAQRFPPTPTRTLKATGSGTVATGGEPTGGGAATQTGLTRGAVVVSPPAPAASSLKLDIPGGEGTILGSPKVTITATGRGTALDAANEAVLFLRVIDRRTQTVIGNQSTPVVLPADGRSHTTSLELEPIVWQLGAKDRLALEILGWAGDFEPQRGAAVMKLDRVDVELPVKAR